jgi:hypothetical protein
MARATKVYVVLKKGNINYGIPTVPLVAFTVKWELARWLDQHGWDEDWLIWSLPDGVGGEPKELKCPQDTHNTGRYRGNASPTDV